MKMPPKTLQLELTNRCNATCLFCNHRKIHTLRGAPDMNIEDAKRLAAEGVALGFTEMRPYYFGEPTLYPHLKEFCEYCTDLGYFVLLKTNGSNDVSQIPAGLHFFSIDYYTPEQCEQIRGLKFDDVVANVKKTVKAGWQTCISCVVTKELGNPSDFKRFWKQRCPKVIMKKEFPYAREAPFELSDYRECDLPFKSITILVDGRCVPCCHDQFGDFAGCNALERGLKYAFLDDPVINEFRMNVKEKNWPFICDTCGIRIKR